MPYRVFTGIMPKQLCTHLYSTGKSIEKLLADHIKHDTDTVHCYSKIALDYLKITFPEQCIYFSDGDGSQCKNFIKLLPICVIILMNLVLKMMVLVEHLHYTPFSTFPLHFGHCFYCCSSTSPSSFSL